MFADIIIQLDSIILCQISNLVFNFYLYFFFVFKGKGERQKIKIKIKIKTIKCFQHLLSCIVIHNCLLVSSFNWTCHVRNMKDSSLVVLHYWSALCMVKIMEYFTMINGIYIYIYIKGEKPLLVPTFLGDFHFSP